MIYRLRPTFSLQHYTRKRFSTSPLSRALELEFDHYAVADTASESKATSKQPFIILHGLFGSKRNYRSISKALVRELGCPVYALDLRNHGDSPHDPQHDYLSLAGDVESFIHRHGLKSPTIIGHSMGAKVAMTLSLKSPSLVGSLVAVDNEPRSSVLSDDFTKYIRAMEEIDYANVSTQKTADEILCHYEPSPLIRQFLLTNLKKVSSGDFLKFAIPLQFLASALNDIASFPYKHNDNVRFERSTLFLRGSRSQYISDDSICLINTFFPFNKLQTIEAGHWIISENPTAFLSAVVSFVQIREGAVIST